MGLAEGGRPQPGTGCRVPAAGAVGCVGEVVGCEAAVLSWVAAALDHAIAADSLIYFGVQVYLLNLINFT